MLYPAELRARARGMLDRKSARGQPSSALVLGFAAAGSRG